MKCIYGVIVVALSVDRRSGHFLAKLTGADDCPLAPPCQCHCDCPDTKYEKPPIPPLPCPIFPVFPTVKPVARKPTTATTTTTSVLVKTIPQCAEGEVLRKDYTCSKVTMEVIAELKSLVIAKRDVLNQSQKKYKGLVMAPEEERANLRKKLLYDHEQYRAALDLLLGASAMLERRKAEVKEKTPESLSPEFGVIPMISGRLHCESWTKNATVTPTLDMCAVICRHQPTCVGFSMSSNFCVWFDKFAPLGDHTPCAAPDIEQYSKRRNGTFNEGIFKKIEMVHRMVELLDTALTQSNIDSAAANDAFTAFDVTKRESESRDKFVKAKGNYTLALNDAKSVYFALKDAITSVLADIRQESVEVAPLETSTTTTTTATTTTIAPPKVINWVDFPNSEDSLWSRRHPGCPMGPPCVCDCKCRGAPPQNFIEPPPPPPQPCPPPPPMPPPSALSLPMGAPPALPLR